MKIFYLLGSGKVGTAIIKHFSKAGTKVTPFNLKKTNNNAKGLLFLATPDNTISELTEKISKSFQSLNIVHFSAAADNKDLNLLHPYCSIGPETVIENVVFTLWSSNSDKIEGLLKKSGLKYIYSGVTPSILYHTSAVLSGNFSQFFSIAAIELLKKEGFSTDDSLKLLSQLMLSSLKNVSEGLEGITGPASRGDTETVKRETAALRTIDRDLSGIFENINFMIKKAVKDGTLFRK